LASVLVRAVSEVWLLPVVGEALDARFGTTFSLERSLHSIGLVLVPLTANAFWKLKLRRGLIQVGVPVFITYAVLRWVLLPMTNLSFGSLELTYEDVARDFLSSPKAYIILLTTALIAARFNLLYGWDFNGILVPALLAVTWVAPGKVLATIAEVLILVAGCKALLSLPGLRTLNLEGPRKTVLVFTLGFALKWVAGWILGGKLPGLKVTDLFGFGYLVPTLLAVKILQKQVVARPIFATLHTSLVGWALGSLIGFGLSLFEPQPVSATASTSKVEMSGERVSDSQLGALAVAHVTARERDGEIALRRKPSELRKYTTLWRQVNHWLKQPTAGNEDAVRRAATALDLEFRHATDGSDAFILAERTQLVGRVGWDTAILFPQAAGPIVEVPRPLTEAPSSEAALTVCRQLNCAAKSTHTNRADKKETR
jgi:gamma-polyglutamate biosynthesis protein CapC